jgi:hypothetical protein
VVLSEEDLVEVSLLRYAQQRATERGAAWFAAELERRELEERRRADPEPHTFLYRVMAGLDDRGPRIEGPVDQQVEERVVTSAPSLQLQRPDPTKHAHVPRPPAETASRGRGRWRRKARPRPTDDAMWMPSPAELARMSPAGRRLYGLDGGG